MENVKNNVVLIICVFLTLSAISFGQNQDFDKSKLESLNQAIAKSPNNPNLYYEMGHFYDVQINDDEKAIEAFTRAINLAPRNTLYIVRRAHLYAESEQYELAIKDYQRASTIDPKFYDYHKYMAECYLKLKEFDKAITEYDKMLLLQPKNFLAYSINYASKAEVYTAKGDFAKAIVFYTKSIKTGGLFTLYVYGVRGDVYLKMNRLDDAIKDYSTAIVMNLKHSDGFLIDELYNKRAEAYLIKNDYEKAISDYQKIIDNDKDLSSRYRVGAALGYTGKGKVYFTKGDYEKAVECFSNSIKSLDLLEETFQLRAKTYEKLGKKDLAALDYAEANRIIAMKKAYQEKLKSSAKN